MNFIRRIWLETVADCHRLTIAECDDAMSKCYPLSDAILALLNSKLKAKTALFKTEAKINGLRQTDGADYAILVAVLVMAAWAYVSEQDYRDLTAGSTVCLYRGVK